MKLRTIIVVSRTILINQHDHNNSRNILATNADLRETLDPSCQQAEPCLLPQASKRSVVSWNLKRIRDPLLAGLLDH
jgi:hypothetical protein